MSLVLRGISETSSGDRNLCVCDVVNQMVSHMSERDHLRATHEPWKENEVVAVEG